MVGLVKLNERISDFGAEQVILVRDEEAKKNLQEEIGDIALILTILQSKGMEFDDVLLYNFFSESSCPSSLRHLGTLVGATEGSVFDSKKHMVLCPELKVFDLLSFPVFLRDANLATKHLYVAVTRARIQLSIIESRKDGCVSEAIRVFTQNTSEPLVDVVHPGDPEASKKAGDEKGKNIATAFIFEEEGRRCKATGDCEGFERNIQAAVDTFRQVRLIGNATENLELLSRFEEAAGKLPPGGSLMIMILTETVLWSEERRYDRSAPLFLRAGLFKQAANDHHLNGKHGEAAAALRQGNHFSELIEYLHKNRHHLGDRDNKTFSRLCNILLKQGRIPIELRICATALLGPTEEQEKFFKEFDMKEQLADLYANSRRFEDLFYLQTERGLLGSALDIAVSHDLLSEVDQPHLMDLLHYSRASCIFYNTNDSTFRFVKILPSLDVSRTESDWEIVSDVVNNWKTTEARNQIADVETILVKQVFSLHVRRCLSSWGHDLILTLLDHD
ncbi:hypothetical protein GP486_004564 [Trichoglossum hirsutum]|uniref:DNA helicase n=1 Tax=Trichoglossum hirsutum TaxID=265104 RepID=A0A9P8LAM9_9PEZI|nr:hypothetical protein GP486_004564 [Trichoglossum hirsutum]